MEAEQHFYSAVSALIDGICGATGWLNEAVEQPSAYGNVQIVSGSAFKGAARRLQQATSEGAGLEEARSSALAAQAKFAAAARRLLEAIVDSPELLSAKASALMILQAKAKEQSYPPIITTPDHRLPQIDLLTRLNGPDGLSDVLMSLWTDVRLVERGLESFGAAP